MAKVSDLSALVLALSKVLGNLTDADPESELTGDAMKGCADLVKAWASDIELDGSKQEPDVGGAFGRGATKDSDYPPGQEKACGDKRASDSRYVGAGSPWAGVPGDLAARRVDTRHSVDGIFGGSVEGSSSDHSVSSIFNQPKLGEG